MTGTNDPDLGLASRLHNLANTLEQSPHLDGYRDCGCLRCRARTFAERGYPAATIGDGGSRSSDRTSSTEREATHRVAADLARLARYPDIIDTLDRALADAQGIVALVLKHGSTDDVIPAGQGPCVIPRPHDTHHVCQPRKNPNDRLRAGLCPSCHQAWLRYQRRVDHPTRAAFLLWRARELAPEPRTQPNMQVIHQNATA